MRVRFLEDFDFKPVRATTIAYRAGMEMTVRKCCGEQAVAAGKAVELAKPARAITEQQRAIAAKVDAGFASAIAQQNTTREGDDGRGANDR